MRAIWQILDIIARVLRFMGDEVLHQQPIQFDRPVQPQITNHNLFAPAQPVVPAYNAEKIESPVDAPKKDPATSNDM